MKDLIDGMGLSGALAAMVWAAYGAVLLYRSLRTTKGGTNGHDTALNAERRTAAAVERILARVDEKHDAVMENINQTRHDIRNTIHEYVWGSKRPRGDS